MKIINYRASLNLELPTYATKISEYKCQEVLLQFLDDMTKDELIQMIATEFYVTGVYDEEN